MMNVLGPQRVLILTALALVNILFAAGGYFYLAPEESAKEQELRQMQNGIAELQTDIERLQVEFGQLEQQQSKYSLLKARGFFSSQDRRQAEKILETIQKKAGVVAAVASIQPGVVEDNEQAQKTGYKILRSPVSVKIDALDDVDVFRYLYLIEKHFPGHVSFTRMNIERKSDVTGTILRSIAAGNNPPLVEAQLNMVWRTMIPESEVIPSDKGGRQ
jgi:hypothetical protein